MSKVGGYIIVDLGPGPINARTGASVPVTVSKETVDALRQWGKPVLIEHTNMTIDGGHAEISGFTFHTLTAGVHMHHCDMVSISVTGDTQITVTVT